MRTLVLIVSDTHCNSKSGLCVPRFEHEEGTHEANSLQVALWQAWGELCAVAAERKAATGARVVLILLGDIVDKNRKDPLGLITLNDPDIVDLGAQCLAPLLQVADCVIFVRGTETHVGEHAMLEEALARRIGAARLVSGRYSGWRYRGAIGGVTFDARHKPETSGRRPWTWRSAVARIADIVADEYQDAGRPVPQVVVRAHVHTPGDSGRTFRPHVLVCPPWQLGTAYSAAIAAQDTRIAVGAWFVECEDGEYEYRLFHRDMEAQDEWQISTASSTSTPTTSGGLLTRLLGRGFRKS